MKHLKKSNSAPSKKGLSYTSEIKVRFSEVDSLQVVWHGHYFKYFEDGREAFGEKYDIDYLQVYDKGFAIPIVEMYCFNKKTIAYGDKVSIVTTFIPTRSAKIIFEFHIYKEIDKVKELVATGKTVQVFVNNKTNMLEFFNPPFYDEWKEKHNILI